MLCYPPPESEEDTLYAWETLLLNIEGTSYASAVQGVVII